MAFQIFVVCFALYLGGQLYWLASMRLAATKHVKAGHVKAGKVPMKMRN